MFRQMRRSKQQLSDAECRQLLSTEKRAVLAVNGDGGYPYAVPINFYYDGDTGLIYFHGSGCGYKADAMQADSRVCLTLWNSGSRREGHWECDVSSVVIFGQVSRVSDRTDLTDKLLRLALKYYPSSAEAEAELASPGRVSVYAIRIEHMTGKLVNEK